MEREKGVAGVHGAVEERLHPQGCGRLFGGFHERGELGVGCGAAGGVFLFRGRHLLHYGAVVELGDEGIEGLHEGAFGGRLVDKRLGACLVVPEVGRGRSGLELFQFLTSRFDVKDSLAFLPVLRATGGNGRRFPRG